MWAGCILSVFLTNKKISDKSYTTTIDKPFFALFPNRLFSYIYSPFLNIVPKNEKNN